MAKDLAAITLIGRLGKDVESRYTPAGKMVSNGSLAVNHYDGTTDWYDLALWGEHWTNLIGYLNKGKQVAVHGRPVMRKWTDSEGRERVSPTVNVSDLQLLGGKSEGQQDSEYAQDEMPF